VYKSLIGIRVKRDIRALNRSDLLEHRGWIRRIPNPDDRRSTLIEITPDGRAAEVATEQSEPLAGQRIRPARLGARPAPFLASHERGTP
jgi:hypothetical protein